MTSLSGTVSTPFQPPGSGKKPFPVAEIEQETEGEIEVQKNEWWVHCQETRDGERKRGKTNCLTASMKRLAGILCVVLTSVHCCVRSFVLHSSLIFAH